LILCQERDTTIMDNRRLFLLAATLLVAFLIYQAWMKDYGPKPAPAAPTPAAATASAPAVAAPPPSAASASAAQSAKPAATSMAPAAPLQPTPEAQGQLIHVRTDVLDLTISTAGANIRDVRLLKYPQDLKNPDKLVHVLDSNPKHLVLLQSGLQVPAGSAAPGPAALYNVPQTGYTLAPGEKSIAIKFSWHNAQGLQVDKIYTFTRSSYQVNVRFQVSNQSKKPWTGASYAQFQNHYEPEHHGFFSAHRYDYQRAAINGQDGYKQYEFKDLAEKPLSESAVNGWTAIVTHYFLAAAIPEAQPHHEQKNFLYGKKYGNDDYLVGIVSPSKTVPAGSSVSFDDKLFLGPKLQNRLAGVAPHLELTVDYGKLTIIAEPIFRVLEYIHRVIGNWGWSILVLTLLLKLVTYKLNEISGRSSAKLRLVQPRLKALQERYKDDRTKLSQQMMEFYKKEKINPMGGCLPMLVQMPVFFALYYVLVYSVELRQSPWIGWIHDLSAPDPLYILPVVYAIVMFIQQRITPQPSTDPMQRKLMMVMPVGIAVLYTIFPSGLALYYVANSVLTIAQQWRINKVIERESKKKNK